MGSFATMQALPLRTAAPAPETREGTARARKISPEAGRALEILGHAIEYLTDEFIHTGVSFSARDPQVEAVKLLMHVSREIYFDCPEMPSLAGWLRARIHSRTA